MTLSLRHLSGARPRRRLTTVLSATALALTGLAFAPSTPTHAALPSQCFVNVNQVTCTISTVRGSFFNLTIPEAVTSITIHAVGERGGNYVSGGITRTRGGNPHAIDATIPVTEGEVITARLMNDGGLPGDNFGGSPVGGAGGASAMVTRGLSVIAQAAGGGGAGVSPDSQGSAGWGGNAGQAGMSGDAGGFGELPALGGGPGTSSAGGPGGGGGNAGGCGGPSFPQESGANGSATNGGRGGRGSYGGGGGGGGRFGGGGGGAGAAGCLPGVYAYAGGGGGGSSIVPAGGSVAVTSGESLIIRITFLLKARSNHSPAAMSFGNVPVGTMSASQTFTVNNTGSLPLSLGNGVFTGTNASSFSKSSDSCSNATVAVGASCQVGIRLSPVAAGAHSAAFTIPDNSPQSPHTVSLTGNGTQPVALASVSSLAFGGQEVGKPGTPKSFSVLNNGNAPLVIASTVIGGANAGDFTTTSNSCTGATLAPNNACTVSVRMTAGAVGSRTGTVTLTHNAANPTVVNLSGIGTPPADLKIRGIGSLYTGRDHLVTRTVTGTGVAMTYPIVVLNEDTVARSYKIALTKTGPGASAEVWTSGFGAKALPTDAAGNFLTASVLPGKTVTYNLKVTPTAPGQTINGVAVALLSDAGGLIEGLSTQTNTAAPTNGTSSYELFVKQSSQPFIGGPVSGQTATGPALNVGNSSPFTVRLKNNGASPQQIGLRLTDVDGCAGAFAVTATQGGVSKTTAVFNGTYLTPLRNPGQYTDVLVTIKRVGAGCPSKTIRVESLANGAVVRTSYLLVNSAYNAATD